MCPCVGSVHPWVLTSNVPVNKELLAGTVLVNKELLYSGHKELLTTELIKKELMIGNVLFNNFYLY